MGCVLIVIRRVDRTDMVWTVEEEVERYLKIINNWLKPMGLLKEAKIYRIEGRRKILERVIK
ncbi:MAG: hypothetical protein DRN04_19780 [Thermoprotei archaeon]|nr:MAG: hypothetical protein DRN04_19780 [Thermoprotei archaeon]